jgi:hypothetical protein
MMVGPRFYCVRSVVCDIISNRCPTRRCGGAWRARNVAMSQ